MAAHRKCPVAKVLLKVTIDRDTGCWEWTGGRTNDGYGLICHRTGSTIAAHRYMYQLLHGPQGSLQVHHTCSNTCCVNPSHLEALTPEEHVKQHTRSEPKPTHCKHGHELSAQNSYIDYKGYRRCRVCNRESARRFRKNHPGYYTAWLTDHPDYHKAWRESHPDYGKQWRDKHPDYFRQRVNRIKSTTIASEDAHDI